MEVWKLYSSGISGKIGLPEKQLKSLSYAEFFSGVRNGPLSCFVAWGKKFMILNVKLYFARHVAYLSARHCA